MTRTQVNSDAEDSKKVWSPPSHEGSYELDTKYRRKPLLASALSLFIPGLGHLYAGGLKQGLMILCLLFGFSTIAGALGLLSTFYGVIALLIVYGGSYLYATIGSFLSAKNGITYKLKSYNRWYGYIAFITLFALIGYAHKTYRHDYLGYSFYTMSAGAMSPTLEQGDQITVDSSYDEFAVGDVVTLKHPGKEKTLVNRLAGLAHDLIEIKEGNVLINGKVVNSLSVPASSRQKKYSITMGKILIPEGHAFVLGDFRDNSYDSRFVGLIPIENIMAKVTYIYYSDDPERIGQEIK